MYNRPNKDQNVKQAYIYSMSDRNTKFTYSKLTNKV